MLRKKRKLFPLKKEGIFAHVWVSPSFFLPFVLPFVLPTLSHFPFSLSLSLSLVIFIVFFLPCLLYFFLPCFLFLFLALFLCFCFMQRRTSRYYIWKVLLINVDSVWLISSFLLVFEIPICYLCFLPWPQPLFGVLFSGVFFCCCFPVFCIGYVFVAFAFCVCWKCPKKGELPH